MKQPETSPKATNSLENHNGIISRMRLRPATVFIAVIAGVILCVGSYLTLNSLLLDSEARQKPRQAQFFAAAIDDALIRLAHLPYSLAINPLTLEALRDGQIEPLNPALATIAEKSGAEFVYLMDINGQTVASSNYLAPDSLIGNVYGFRPYFRDAVSGGVGRFYAVGVTTGRPGYFIAEPVRDPDGTIFGVVVVKIGFGDLSRSLANSGELVLVTNPSGVVIISSEQDLVYGLLSPLNAFQFRTLEQEQQFGDEELHPLDWVSEQAGRVRLNGTRYLWTRTEVGDIGWTLHLLSDIRGIQRQALLYVAIGLMGVLALIVAAAIYRSSQLRQALMWSNSHRVRLLAEIEEREAAEARLAIAREELVRKNRLAALGQLSASITHELGQPISAMRNYLTAEEITTGAPPGGLFPQLTGLVERMQRTLDQLRLFGRSDPALTAPFCVHSAIAAAVQLVKHTAESAGAQIDVRLEPGACHARGQSNRFEQIIVNLLRNAIDAVAGKPAGQITLTQTVEGSDIVITVADNGHGLGKLDMNDLREPFFSTKPSGMGMGLGLAISAQIVNEMGGEIGARNGPDQGAIFVVKLLKIEPADA